MCLAVPGKVVKRDDDLKATVDGKINGGSKFYFR